MSDVTVRMFTLSTRVHCRRTKEFFTDQGIEFEFTDCDYREPDVAEYGSCYCNLYVSKEWLEGKIPHEYVPERRPPEKCGY